MLNILLKIKTFQYNMNVKKSIKPGCHPQKVSLISLIKQKRHKMNATNASLPTVIGPTWDIEASWFMFTWILPAICLFGVVTNLLNIIVFSHSELKEDIYKYMLAHSVSDFLYTFCVFFTWISRSRYPIASTYFAKWYEIFIFFTSLNGLGTMSALVEIAISFDRLFLIKKSLKIPKIPPYFVISKRTKNESY